MLRFLLWFIAIQVVLFGLELTPWVQKAVVVPWTNTVAAISASIVKAFDPSVIAHGKILQSSENQFAVSIEAGCNGVEATIVLLAAVLAFPASWRSKLIGLAAGFVAVQGLNVIRVISLFYLGQWNREAFEWAHMYLWQALIMLDVLIVWLLWVRSLGRGGGRGGGPGGGPPPGAVAATNG